MFLTGMTFECNSIEFCLANQSRCEIDINLSHFRKEMICCWSYDLPPTISCPAYCGSISIGQGLLSQLKFQALSESLLTPRTEERVKNVMSDSGCRIDK